MIVASRKPISEIKRVLARHDKVLFVGCGTCVTVCLAGGEREVGIATYATRMARKIDGKPIEIEQVTIERQCENEFIEDLAAPAQRNQAIVSFACGAGVQALAERFPNKPVYAALNTQFLGILEEQAVWTEKCLGCGDCMLSEFGGICPVTRCAKRMLNGPCGGSTEEHCEVSDPARPCAWQLIYKRLDAIGQLENIERIMPAKNWAPSWHGGARTIVREEHRIAGPGTKNAAG
jgi:ferredoxin